MTAHSVLNVRAAPKWGNSELQSAQKERSRLRDRSYSHQIDLAKEFDDSQKLFYIYQHFQDTEKVYQIKPENDLSTTDDDSLYPYINNNIEYGLFEDIVDIVII